ncbi:hypothetical protein ACO1PF_09660 [Alkalibacterium sp. f15]|uniref:hypothetical protein n=1 Tax=Alkalibacterium sp. f15 TaxID=3414029 RepID=UPI003BF8B344
MTSTEANVAYIKWDKKNTELVALLKGHTKAELVDQAERQAVAVKKSWNKTEMVNALAENTTEQAETIYHPILKEVLIRLPDLETNIYRVKTLTDIEGFVPLIKKGFFFVAREADSILLLIPEEVLFSVRDRLQSNNKTADAFSSSDNKKAQILNSWKEKAMAIYGNVSLEHLKTTWNRYFDEPVTIEEIKDLLN